MGARLMKSRNSVRVLARLGWRTCHFAETMASQRFFPAPGMVFVVLLVCGSLLANVLLLNIGPMGWALEFAVQTCARRLQAAAELTRPVN
jgi:hypothetical protein